MNNKNRHRMSFWIMDDTHERLKKLADREKINTSELLRQMIVKELSIKATNDDIDNIRSHIRAELESYLKPQIERIIKCVVKGGVVSASSYFLNAKAIDAFVPQHMQEEYEKSLTESKKIGIAYMRVRDKKIDDFMEEE